MLIPFTCPPQFFHGEFGIAGVPAVDVAPVLLDVVCPPLVGVFSPAGMPYLSETVADPHAMVPVGIGPGLLAIIPHFMHCIKWGT